MENSIVLSIMAAAIIAGTPLLYAALGEILAERSGVLNLGVEGMMLAGAVSGFMVTVMSGNNWLGLIFAILAGGFMALIHAFLCVTLKANQVVSGLALTIFGTGVSGYLGKSLIGIPAPVTFEKIPIPVLAKIPVLGPVLFNHDALVYISYILVPLIWFFLYRTNAGLKLRSVGENPAAADAVGVNVFLTRYVYVIVGGMLAGIGGAYLSLAYAPTWLEHMTAGRGWIAVALVIFAVWDPVRALIGAYIFGGVDALGFRLQAMGIMIPSFFLKMLPYIFTIVVLILATRETHKKRVGAPGSLTLPYDREER
ncbi:MAG: ral nucleoside transport system permease protein [Clostridia bacterium]|jgi:simple sugar transport system permease protein|nr:putative ABC-type transport system, permease component [Clostridiales bacterium]MDK2985593.1 ral nucleoside transport system permease protein [Clostridia bacterium]